MRVLLAGISSFSILMLAVVIMAGPLESRLSNSVATFLLILIFFLAIFVSCVVFNERSQRWPYQTVEEMEEQGLIVSAEFRAKRAFQVEEYEDEGLHYYLELDDGGVLYLNGQYLYDYEPIDDDPEVNQARKFPCTDFVVKRHIIEGYVVEIVTRGTPFEAEEIAPSFSRSDYRLSTVPEDGDIIRDKPYEEIKNERLNSK